MSLNVAAFGMCDGPDTLFGSAVEQILAQDARLSLPMAAATIAPTRIGGHYPGGTDTSDSGSIGFGRAKEFNDERFTYKR